mmetsp:Transcript_2780/g.3851  ORF Transcript_2780/g.3851 Transcript_2780/m.3851 type:complete len:468 (+) Transcript_2780:425-1828(+)
MGIPMLTVGIKRWTHSGNRGFAFGLFYSVMNIAAFVSGLVVDLANYIFPTGNATISANRVIILSTTIIYFVSLMTTAFFIREIRLEESSTNAEYSSDMVGIELQELDIRSERTVVANPIFSYDENVSNSSPETHKPSPTSPLEVNDSTNRVGKCIGRHGNQYEPLRFHDVDTEPTTNLHSDTETSPASTTPAALSRHPPPSDLPAPPSRPSEPSTPNNSNTGFLGSVVRSATFWRFCLFSLFLINLRALFRHLDATLPTFLIRCFGPQYPRGTIYSINPFMIIWLTPIVSALTSTWPHFSMIKYGSYVSAASPFFLACSTSTWAVVLFVVLLSLGEAIWSPRLYDYTMSVAPEGKEATFSALASAPLFAAKVPVGLLSGYLISKYLPDDGNSHRDDARTMWLIIGLLTMTSPVCITLFESCIREPVEQVNDNSTHSQQEEVSVGINGLEDKRTINSRSYEEVKSVDE